MQSHGDKEIIVKYSIENKDNLAMALCIKASFDDIRKTVITNFLEELENQLRKALDDEWEVSNDLIKNPFDRYNGLYITKKNWNRKYFVGISPEKYGARGFIIGVYGSGAKIIKNVGDGKLKTLLDDQYKPGLPSDYWEWYQWLGGIYENWDNDDVLLKMYEKTDIVEFFKKQILEIKRISCPLIDEALKTREDLEMKQASRKVLGDQNII